MSTHTSYHMKEQADERPSSAELRNSAVFNRTIVYLYALLLCFVTYSCLLWRYHFSTDSYLQIYDMAPYWHLQLGRFLNFALTMLIERIGLNTVVNQRIFLCIWVAATAVSILIMEMAYETVAGQKVTFAWRLLATSAISIAFINVFYLELILFPEMALFLAFAEISLSLSVYFFLANKPYSKLVSSLFLLIAIGGYQSLIGYYVAFTLCGIMCKLWNDGAAKTAVVESLQCCFIGVFIAVFDVLLVKVLVQIGFIADSGRGASLSITTILANIRTIVDYQKQLLTNADGLLPGPWIMLYVCVLALLSIRHWISANWDFKVVYLLAAVASVLFAYSAHVVEAHIELTHRSNIAIWAVLSAFTCLLLVQEFNSPLQMRASQSYVKNPVLVTAVMLLLLVNVLSIQDIALDSYASNYLDRAIADQIDLRLDKYEEDTGITVKSIAVARDSDPTMSYPETRYHGAQLGVRILQVDYSYWCLINYISGRNLIPIEMSQEDKARLFPNQDWERLDLDEQLIIENDTAYLVLY